MPVGSAIVLRSLVTFLLCAPLPSLPANWARELGRKLITYRSQTNSAVTVDWTAIAPDFLRFLVAVTAERRRDRNRLPSHANISCLPDRDAVWSLRWTIGFEVDLLSNYAEVAIPSSDHLFDRRWRCVKNCGANGFL